MSANSEILPTDFGQESRRYQTVSWPCSCRNTAIELSSGTVTDAHSQLDVASDGKVAIHGTSAIRGSFDVQCVNANGDVQLTAVK
jgi:hypothetical protein